MAYSKTVWVDRVSQFPNRYTKQNETSTQVELIADEGIVTEQGTFVNASLLNKMEQGIADMHKITNITLTTTWVGTTAPFTQVITVSGVTSNDVPIISPIYSSTNTTAILEKIAWSKVGKATTGNNSITFTCFEEKPITAINLQVKGV